jgi:hypothetical protein
MPRRKTPPTPIQKRKRSCSPRRSPSLKRSFSGPHYSDCSNPLDPISQSEFDASTDIIYIKKEDQWECFERETLIDFLNQKQSRMAYWVNGNDQGYGGRPDTRRRVYKLPDGYTWIDERSRQRILNTVHTNAFLFERRLKESNVPIGNVWGEMGPGRLHGQNPQSIYSLEFLEPRFEDEDKDEEYNDNSTIGFNTDILGSEFGFDFDPNELNDLNEDDLNEHELGDLFNDLPELYVFPDAEIEQENNPITAISEQQMSAQELVDLFYSNNPGNEYSMLLRDIIYEGQNGIPLLEQVLPRVNINQPFVDNTHSGFVHSLVFADFLTRDQGNLEYQEHVSLSQAYPLFLAISLQNFPVALRLMPYFGMNVRARLYALELILVEIRTHEEFLPEIVQLVELLLQNTTTPETRGQREYIIDDLEYLSQTNNEEMNHTIDRILTLCYEQWTDMEPSDEFLY